MGTARPFTPEKLVVGILSSLPDGIDSLRDCLQGAWGRIDYVSAPVPFSFTTYYEAEMGRPILRWFVSFEPLVDPSRLAGIKRESNALEDRFRREGARRVNLDPGCMALSRFSLATTKESAHRVPLSQGIYAEVTLRYVQGEFRALEWTYPDYRSAACRSALNDIRAIYRSQLRSR
jgi:hypothetical protein